MFFVLRGDMMNEDEDTVRAAVPIHHGYRVYDGFQRLPLASPLTPLRLLPVG